MGYDGLTGTVRLQVYRQELEELEPDADSQATLQMQEICCVKLLSTNFVCACL